MNAIETDSNMTGKSTPTSASAAHAAAAAQPGTASCGAQAAERNVFWQDGELRADTRAHQFGLEPATFWLTGLSGAGKSTIAYAFEQRLRAAGRACAVLDGDNLRHRLNSDLGFTDGHRRENVRRTAEVARLMNDVGLIVIASLVSPFRDDRESARTIIGTGRFVEVYVSTPLAVCEARDPKGLYRKARHGDIREFTGVTSPYEPPSDPAVVVDTSRLAHADAALLLEAYVARHCKPCGDLLAG
jgi:adenylylsulfate kinase